MENRFQFGVFSSPEGPPKKQIDVLSKVRAYFDFDGTFTWLEGGKCVSSPLFKTLQKPLPSLFKAVPGNPGRYVTCQFKPEAEMVALLTVGLTKEENSNMRVSPDALEFLIHLIEQGAQIYIISKNRNEFIRANFLVAGMDPNLLNKIHIVDVRQLINNSKYDTILALEKIRDTTAKITVICDDSKTDCDEMKKAIEGGALKTSILSYCQTPGSFNWKKIADDINENILNILPNDEVQQTNISPKLRA